MTTPKVKTKKPRLLFSCIFYMAIVIFGVYLLSSLADEQTAMDPWLAKVIAIVLIVIFGVLTLFTLGKFASTSPPKNDGGKEQH